MGIELLPNILSEFALLRNSKNIEGMKRFGIVADKAFGIPTPTLRNMAKKYKGDHELAIALWNSGYHEARRLAALVADPKQTTSELMDAWVQEFYSWDICDSACFDLFRKLPLAYSKIEIYADDEREFVKRTAFSLMAGLAINDKKTPDTQFEPYFNLIIQASTDERNFVKKAVNWALRQIGKRSLHLHKQALDIAKQLAQSDNKTARWIGMDAARELSSEKIIQRIKK